jgi:rubrerythrin
MVDKEITMSGGEEIHFGVKTLEGFESASDADVDEVLANLGSKKLWRCTVCNDLHVGAEPPKECPTCVSIDAYVEIDEEEFRGVLEVGNG